MMRMRRLTVAAASAFLMLAIAAPVTAQSSGAVLPFIGSAPETGFQGGLAYLRVWQPEDSLGTRPSSRMGNIVFTEKKQFRAFIESDRWTAGNERRRQWGVIAMSFPLPYYGYRVSAPHERITIDNDVVELWMTRSRLAKANVWRSLGARVVVNASDGGIIYPDLTCDTEPAPDPCPASGWIGPSGVAPSLKHVTALLSAARVFDSRDRLFAPTSGSFVDLTLTGASNFTDNETFGRLRIDARRFRSAARGTVALQALLQGTEGRPTVDQLVVMGSNTVLRGYEMGRLRDKWLLGGQAEFRGPEILFNDRIGFVAFAGGAIMASRLNTLPKSDFFPSAGAGLRWRLDRRSGSAVRIDYAFGRSGNSGLYIAFNEAF